MAAIEAGDVVFVNGAGVVVAGVEVVVEVVDGVAIVVVVVGVAGR